MSLIENNIFNTPIYFSEKKDWVEKVNKISDPYIHFNIQAFPNYLISK
jgi:hypothetical protein